MHHEHMAEGERIWCSEDLGSHATSECDSHARFACPDVVMHRYVNRDGPEWFGIPVHDGGTSAISVNHCPWCGAALI
jgi:hypothetical protein